MEGRKKKAARNIAFGLIGQVITMVMSFVSRTVFLYCFSQEYVGVVSLFSGVFSFLTLADLGMEASLTVKLYHALAANDHAMLKSLLAYYKRIFNIIALVIFGAGLALLPFLDFFVDLPENVPNIELIYVLSLLNASISYLYVYKKTLFIADQKKYITDIIQYGISLTECVVAVPVLLLSRSYIVYLILQSFFKLLYNFMVMLYAKKTYSEVENAQRYALNSAIRQAIGSDMRAISLHRIGDVISSNSWSILVSAFVNVVTAGIYSNYQLIINYTKVIMDKIYYALSPSIGNLIATENSENVYNFFEKMLFISFVMTCFFGTGLLCMLNPFIYIWLGDSFILPHDAVIISIVNFYLVNMRKPVLIFKEAYGLFQRDRFRPLVESFINIATALVLCNVLDWGIVGVLLGISIAYMLTTFWVEPYILFKYGLKHEILSYFKQYIGYALCTTAVMVISVFLCGLIPAGILGFILSGIICTLVSLMTIVLLFHKTAAYQWTWQLFLRVFRRFCVRH